MATPVNNAPWMEWIEALMSAGTSRQSYAATFPPDRYYCLLDELPLHLIPQRAAASFRADEAEFLWLDQSCIVCDAGQLPEEIAAEKDLLAVFALQRTTIWVRNSITGMLLPFWLGPRLEPIVRNLRSGEPVNQNLEPDVLALLAGAGVVTSTRLRDASLKQWEQTLKNSAPLFQRKGYAPLAGLIHPFHVASLRRYYRHLIRTGKIQLGDGQSPRRYVAYNEPVARFFHRQIAPVLSAVAGEPLKPSYVYLASYLSGAELKRHTDRPQCEFSVTLCLDFSPEPVFETSWPIQLDTAAGHVAIYQALGDGLAYRGTRLPHYRGALKQGCTSTSIFFHYVPADFTGSLD